MKLIVIAAIALAFAAPASAQQKKKNAARAAQKHKAHAPQPKRPPSRSYDFEADEIDGDRVRPDGTTIFGLQSARHGSLIKLRGHFVREIVRSADEVQ